MTTNIRLAEAEEAHQDRIARSFVPDPEAELRLAMLERHFDFTRERLYREDLERLASYRRARELAAARSYIVPAAPDDAVLEMIDANVRVLTDVQRPRNVDPEERRKFAEVAARTGLGAETIEAWRAWQAAREATVDVGMRLNDAASRLRLPAVYGVNLVRLDLLIEVSRAIDPGWQQPWPGRGAPA